MSGSDHAMVADWSNRSIALAGFMGVGKSSIGRRLATLLDRPFYDSDSAIVDRMGMSIQAMFDLGEERRFREVEREVITELCQMQPPAVIALGGGALNDDATLQLLLDMALLVHIHLSWERFETLLPRLRRGRPLLASASLGEVHELYMARESRYRSCHLTVELRREGVRKSAGLLCDALSPYGIGRAERATTAGQLP